MSYKDPKGEVRVGRVQIDTQSNVNYALPGVTLRREWLPWESREVMGMKRERVTLQNPTSFTVIRDDKPITIDTCDPHARRLSSDCIALLGLEAIQKLGIDLNYHARFQTHKTVKYIDSLEDTVQRCDEELRQTLEDFAEPLSPTDMYKTVDLSERVIEEYLRTHKGEYESKPIKLGQIDINPRFSDKGQRALLDLIKKYREVFARATNTLPPPMKGVKPHKFKLKPDAQPTTVPPQKFGPAKSKLVMEWLQWAIDNDLVESAEGSSYSSRLHLAAKRKATTAKSEPPDGIRIT